MFLRVTIAMVKVMAGEAAQGNRQQTFVPKLRQQAVRPPTKRLMLEDSTFSVRAEMKWVGVKWGELVLSDQNHLSPSKDP